MPIQVTVSEINLVEMKPSSDGVMFATVFVTYVDSGCITVHFPLPAGVTELVMPGRVYFDADSELDFFRTTEHVLDAMSVSDMIISTDIGTDTSTIIGPLRTLYDVSLVAYRWNRIDLVNYWIINFLNTALCRDLTRL